MPHGNGTHQPPLAPGAWPGEGPTIDLGELRRNRLTEALAQRAKPVAPKPPKAPAPPEAKQQQPRPERTCLPPLVRNSRCWLAC